MAATMGNLVTSVCDAKLWKAAMAAEASFDRREGVCRLRQPSGGTARPSAARLAGMAVHALCIDL